MGEARAGAEDTWRIPRGWAIACWVGALISFAVPVWNQFLRDPRMDPQSRWQNLVLCVLLGAAFVRGTRLRVETSASGITVVGWAATTHIPWADVTTIELRPHTIQGEFLNHWVAIGRRTGKRVGAAALNPDLGGGKFGPQDRTEYAIERLTELTAQYNASP